jgi:hypothetical protein
MGEFRKFIRKQLALAEAELQGLFVERGGGRPVPRPGDAAGRSFTDSSRMEIPAGPA